MKQTNQDIVLIVAGGRGLRMNSDIPKQFIEIATKPILVHTFEKFIKYNPNLSFRIVLPEAEYDKWELIRSKYFGYIKIDVFIGGSTRYESVKNGLENIPPHVLVAVHDAVRPFVSIKTIKRCFKLAREKGAVIPVVPVKNSIRKIQENKSYPVNRNNLVAVQTPQVFKSEILTKAYQSQYQSSFTDDATVVEYSGFPIHTTEGTPENFKITTPSDLLIAETFIKAGI